MKLLDPKEFESIDADEVIKQVKEVINIPNDIDYQSITYQINAVKNKDLPYTLRTFELITLPYVVVKIMVKNT